MNIFRLLPLALFLLAPSLLSDFCRGGGQSVDGVEVRWLEGRSPGSPAGTSWGVPWPRGTLKKGTELALSNAAGNAVPLQTWPLAYWPDGSLKWTGHAMFSGDVGKDKAGSYTLKQGTPTAPQHPVTVKEPAQGTADAEAIVVDTGVIQCRISTKGNPLIQSIARDGKEMARGGHLVCVIQDRPDTGEEGGVKSELFAGEITSVLVEKRGPVVAVIKMEGKHVDAKSGRACMPFIVRLYFYAGAESIRIMHTIVYDADPQRDFIRGLGLRFNVPMRGEPHNRHVRFGGEDGGVWGEAVRGITGLRRDPGASVREAQVAGRATPALDTWDKRVSGRMDLIPAFGDFTLVQGTSGTFEIRKRTGEGLTWLASASGTRASGLGWIGSPEGGMAFGVRNFWQSYPGQLDIRKAATDTATVTMWLWSPESRPMDLRPYHNGMGEDTYEKQLQGLEVTYEDYEPGFDTPHGVARTSEMMLWALPATPARDDTAALSNLLRTPPQLVCSPAVMKNAGVFGDSIWSLPDRSTPLKAQMEDQLDFYFDTYRKEVVQRNWYGFWNYGDVMHSYDGDRHVWRYDVGGYAWDNSELSTDLWLWYAFLRSGRADIYRMAEAMTRHTGEVDVYHLGRFAGLGTRHGVLHWGDSAKQLRISTAMNRRFLYYLTGGDERIGDLLREQLQSVRKLAEVPAGRKITKAPPSVEGKPYPLTMSVGTDWGAVAAALLTEWERTEDTASRDKLINAMKTIAALPHGWLSGGGGYDPATGRFYAINEEFNVTHLGVVFGGFEVNAELLQLLDVPEYERAWLQYCELYNAGSAEQKKVLGTSLSKLGLGQAHSRLTAYAAKRKSDPTLATRGWKEFFGAAEGIPVLSKPFPIKHLQGPDVLQPLDEVRISTNGVAQWGLACMQCIALIGNDMPKEAPAASPTSGK